MGYGFIEMFWWMHHHPWLFGWKAFARITVRGNGYRMKRIIFLVFQFIHCRQPTVALDACCTAALVLVGLIVQVNMQLHQSINQSGNESNLIGKPE